MKRLCVLSFFFLLVGSLVVLPYTTPAHATPVDVTFTFFPSALVGVDSIPSYDFSFTNKTGVTWTDFHFTTYYYIPPDYTGPGPVIAFSWFGTDMFSTNPYVGLGTATLSTGPSGLKNILDVVDLNIPDNGQYKCTVNVFSTPDSHQLGFYPTAAGEPGPWPGPGPEPGPVPEPATILLLGSGLLGLLRFRKKFKK